MTREEQSKLLRSKLSRRALANVDETGIEPLDDLHRLMRHEISESKLLAECLEGADPDRVAGWQSYVFTLEIVALAATLDWT